MINNLELIKPLLDFSDPDCFYYLMILVRKKDQDIPENHQSVRIIKTYTIGSMEYLEKKWEEIMNLCEVFKARAYINVNPATHKKVTLYMLREIAKRVTDGNWDTSRLYDFCMGATVGSGKKWIVDLDSKDTTTLLGIQEFLAHCCKPYAEDKVISIIPTPQGYHLITKRFSVKEFQLAYPDDVASVKRANPTILYFPKSLSNEDK